MSIAELDVIDHPQVDTHEGITTAVLPKLLERPLEPKVNKPEENEVDVNDALKEFARKHTLNEVANANFAFRHVAAEGISSQELRSLQIKHPEIVSIVMDRHTEKITRMIYPGLGTAPIPDDPKNATNEILEVGSRTKQEIGRLLNTYLIEELAMAGPAMVTFKEKQNT